MTRKKKFVYVVMGGAGEYEDFHEWTVCAFSTSAKAKKFMAELTRVMRKLPPVWEDSIDFDFAARRRYINKTMLEAGDPDFDDNPTHVQYSFGPVEVRE